jgi:hypothetical protein
MVEAKMKSTEEIVSELINDDRTIDTYQKYLENSGWAKKNFENIKKKYRGQMIAIHDKQIIFGSKNARDIREKLRSFDPVQRNQVYIRYIPEEDEIVLW